MQVIGTAGHVDHGKSTLINRLTGINPDRLKTEQEREMSIELGFAWLKLPNGDDVGIIDVPGHRDFIENMLAGIGGIDAALFVVAADEGVMPQTREHLAILDLLQIPAGVVVLTKIDLVNDPEWLDLVEADLGDTLKGTVLSDAPIVRVSARTGEGLEKLVVTIQSVLKEQPHRLDLGRPRLPIDRVFTLPGFGTIVTGTLIDGRLSVGDDVEILPQRITGRVRGLQTHQQKESHALPGSRTAVNISGISVQKIERGNVLVHPRSYQTSTMIDVWCKLLPDIGFSIKHNTEVKLFLGAAEIIGRVRLLGTKELFPGRDAFMQLLLTKPVTTRRNDRFIIRCPSPPATIGGGQVLDPHPQRRHRRFNAARLEELEHLLSGSAEDVLLQTLQKLSAASLDELVNASGLEEQLVKQTVENLVKQGDIISLETVKLLMPAQAVNHLNQSIADWLMEYHQKNPLQPGVSREQVKSQFGLENKVFDALINRMALEGRLVEEGANLRLTHHQVQFSDAQQAAINRLLNAFDQQPYTPPSMKQSIEMIGEDLVRALITTNDLVLLGDDVLLQAHVFAEMRQSVVDHIQQEGEISLAQLRDKFNTSRKYAVAVLDELDQTGVTIRRGDVRILKSRQTG